LKCLFYNILSFGISLAKHISNKHFIIKTGVIEMNLWNMLDIPFGLASFSLFLTDAMLAKLEKVAAAPIKIQK